MEEKYMINSIWNRRISKWNVSDIDKIYILRFIDDLEEGRLTKKKYTMTRIMASICTLKICIKHLDIPFSELVLSDIELLMQSLQSGEIKKINGEPYNEFTIREMSKLLRSYDKWKSENEVVQSTEGEMINGN